MINEIQGLIQSYSDWLRDNTTLKEIDSWVEITTPYLDRHNDCLQIYAKRQEGGYLLTDDGYILDDLELSGCSIESDKRKTLLFATAQGFGIEVNGKELQIRASSEDFSLRKHNLLQAMLAVNDLFYLASPNIANLFFEDVTAWLDQSDIRHSPRVKFTGVSGYDHLFDFVIPKSRVQPERMLSTINRPTRESAQTTAFSWLDTKEVRAQGSQAYALLNDGERPIPAGVQEALQAYDLKPIRWSERDQVREELAA